MDEGAGDREDSPLDPGPVLRLRRPKKEEPDPHAEELALWCLDRNSGEVLWKRSLGGSNRQLMKQNMSSPSPVTDGEHVWVMTGTGILKSFDFKGKEIWSRDIQADYGEFGLMWGYASSPLLYNDNLYVQVLHGMKTNDPSYLLGIDPATGSTPDWHLDTLSLRKWLNQKSSTQTSEWTLEPTRPPWKSMAGCS